jgi:hypothetical protein
MPFRRWVHVFVMAAMATVSGAADPPVVTPDGVAVDDAKVTIAEDGRCWVAAPGRAPALADVGAETVVVPAVVSFPLRVLDAETGEPVEAGVVEWSSDAPEELRRWQWAAPGGDLELAADIGASLVVTAERHRPAEVVLDQPGRRMVVALEPVGTITVATDPAADGRVLVAAVDELSWLNPFPGAAEEHELVAGEATLDGLVAGRRYRVAVLPEGFLPVIDEVAAPDRLEPRLDAGEQLTGAVVDEEGEPVAGAAIIAVATPDQDDGGVEARQRATAGDDGGWSLSGLPAGPAEVAVEAEGYARRAVRVELPAARPLRVELHPGIDLELKVVDGSGVAREGVDVRGDTVRVTTDGSGVAVLPGREHGEVLELELAGGGIVPTTRSIEVVESQVLVVVDAGATIVWPVFGAAADTAGAVWVRRRDRTGREVSSTRGEWSPEAGEAVGSGLPDGTYVLDLRLEDLAPVRSDPVEILAPETRYLAPVTADAGAGIEGRVVDFRSGEPVPGAVVAAEEGRRGSFRGGPSGSREPARSARTDADGLFTLLGLEEDAEYTLRTTAPGYVATVTDAVVASLDRTRIDDIEMGPGGSVVGIVERRDGSSVAGARVEVREPGLYAYHPEAEASSGPGGRFEIDGVPPGRWVAVVTDNGDDRSAPRDVDVDHGEEVEVRLVVGGTRVEGIVRIGDEPASGGRVILAAPAPTASGPVVMVTPPGGGRRMFGLGRQPVETAVDPGGRFAFDEVTPGTVDALYVADDGSRATTTATIPDVEVHRLELRYPGGRVSGVVVDDDDRPVSGALVEGTGPGGEGRRALTAARGRFALTGLAPGRWRLVGRHDEAGRGEATADVQADAPVDITIRLEREDRPGLTVTLSSVAGTVSGAPVLLGGGQRGMAYADSAGRAVFSDLTAGSYRACARAFGGSTGCTGPVMVEEGRPAEVPLRLGAGGWIEVPEVDDDEGGRVRMTVTLPDGTDLTGLALGSGIVDVGEIVGPFEPGAYQVTVSGEGWSAAGLVEVREGETTTIPR